MNVRKLLRIESQLLSWCMALSPSLQRRHDKGLFDFQELQRHHDLRCAYATACNRNTGQFLGAVVVHSSEPYHSAFGVMRDGARNANSIGVAMVTHHCRDSASNVECAVKRKDQRASGQRTVAR
jgi:hypothetical protein